MFGAGEKSHSHLFGARQKVILSRIKINNALNKCNNQIIFLFLIIISQRTKTAGSRVRNGRRLIILPVILLFEKNANNPCTITHKNQYHGV